MQDNTKSVAVKMTARRCFRTDPIYQYDVGHVLTFEGFELPTAFEVHFARSPLGKAVTQIGTDGTCTLPDMFAQTAGVIYAWLYIADADSGLTKYSIEIPVAKRAQITDQEPTPVEQSAIDQAIAALNAGVEAAEDAQEAAEAAQASAESYAEGAGQSAITATNADNSATSAKTAAETAARNAATSATDAHTSREAADQSATNAGVSERNAAASASAAAGSATSAATSAGQASASATAASGSASTASTKASEAAQSATDAAGSAASASEDAGTASTAATAAEQSATAAAGSATAAAGSATSAGQSATAAAGSAQAAQDVLDSIPADYSELSGEVDTLLSAINELEPKVDSLEINKADVIINTASGSIASFPDGADGLPVKSLSVAIEPVQDLHGYDSPWPAGGGKNLFGGEYGTKWILPTPIIISAGDSLAISASVPASGNSRINIYTGKNGATRYFNAGLNDTVNGRKVRIATFTEDITITAFLMDVAECTDIQIEKGSTVTAYTPYSNICPISGWTGANVYRAGVNLFTGQMYKGRMGSDGIFIGNDSYADIRICNTNSTNGITQWLAEGTYTISGSNLATVSVLTKNKSFEIVDNFAYQWNNLPFTFTLTAPGYIYFTINNNGETISPEGQEIQIQQGSTATAYEPYSGQTYSITLPSEAGTVYGGELTVNEDGTGQVVVDMAYRQMTAAVLATFGESNRGYYSSVAQLGGSPGVWFRNMFNSDGAKSRQVGGIKANCNAFPITMNNSSVISSQNRTVFGVDGTNINSVETFIAAVQALENGGSGLFIVYELATPQTYTLTASLVTTLLGTNNVWADAGDVAVSYRADTKLYIDNKITQAIAAALNA